MLLAMFAARKRNTALVLLLFVVSLSGILPSRLLWAQESDKGSEYLDSLSALERKTLALDIAVSSYYELMDLAQRFNLPTEGTSQDLRQRLYGFFKLENPVKPSATALTIESASSFSTFSAEQKTSNLIQLSGPVILKISTSDGFLHRISADRILYDSEKNIAEAWGNIEYTREGNGRTDRFAGSHLIVDLAQYSGVFLDGSFNLEPSSAQQRTLLLHFDRLVKRSENVSAVESATLTACNELPPHYYIKAAKVWLFDSGDWALSNAVLYIGVVPVLWLPFFYYPSQEIVFHPVVGARTRAGAYFQSTTYLIGEKPVSTSAMSVFTALNQGAAMGKTEMSGVFLKRTGSTEQSSATAAGTQGSSSIQSSKSLKLMADLYSALGVYAGIAGYFPIAKSSGKLEFAAGIGVSRSLFPQSTGYYSPFDYAGNYVSVWNQSSFFGAQLPFRYGMTFSYKNTVKNGPFSATFSADIPFFSDPYFEQDFLDRNESSNVFSMFGAVQKTISRRSTLTDTLQGSLAWTFASSSRAPLLKALSFSRLQSQLISRTRSQPTSGLTAQQKRLLSVDPQRDFYYPDEFRVLDASMAASGTLFSFKKSQPSGTGQGTVAASQGQQPSLPPAQADSEAAVLQNASSPAAGTQKRDFSQFASRLDWSISASGMANNKFRSNQWNTPVDIDASSQYFLLGYRGNLRFALASSFAENLLSQQVTLNFNAQDQYRPYLYDERSSPTSPHPYRLTDYAYRSNSADFANELSFQPLPAGTAFSSTSLQYSLKGTLFSTKYQGLSGSGVDAAPIYATDWFSWTSAYIQSHTLSINTGYAKTGKPSQRLSFSASLPPLDEKYATQYSLQAKQYAFVAQGSLTRNSGTSQLEPSSLNAQLKLGGGTLPSLNSELVWDFVTSAPLSLAASASWKTFSGRFSARKAKGYDFSSGTWIPDGTEYFRPYDFSLAFAPIWQTKSKAAIASAPAAVSAISTDEVEDEAEAEAPASETQAPSPQPSAVIGQSVYFSLKPKLSYTQNIIRFTESTLAFSLDASIATEKGTKLTFSSSSINKSAWRYWPGMFPITTGLDPNAYARNPITDIYNSLAIWDSARLKTTLFKLQTLSLSLSQDLHDWTINAGLGMSPVLITPDSGRPYYQLDFSFTFAVTWKDVPEIKTQLSYKEGSLANE